MLKLKTKLFIYYLFVVVLLAGWAIAFCLKHFVLAWLVLYPLVIFSRYIFHPMPKAYRHIYSYLYVKIILIIFVMIAFSIAAINMLGSDMDSAILDKINNYGFLLMLITLVPVFALTIREEVKAVNNAG